MLFNSFLFVAFFAVVYGLYCVLCHRAQNLLLLIASYVFYGWWDWRFLSLILVSTIVDYAAGLGLGRATSQGTRRLLLTASVVTNLGILFTFKYFGFFAESFGRLLGVFGLSLDMATVNVVLPVGISFYTFQTMSYTIDVYRGRLAPTRDFWNFALFVAFFPQLVAGPIERARHLLPQMEAERRITSPRVQEGLWLLLLGYFKKLVIADNMIPFTEPVFGDPESASGLAIIVAVYAFAFQIYGDFSGYSDIARGLGKLMGFDIMLNFRFPYFATNPRDFWRRWHISLSTWLRDYLYIPLGGNRHGRASTDRNLMLTMVLGGLWHGAAWNFVAWGLFHGGLLIVHRRLEMRDTGRPLSGVRQAVAALGYFQLTCVGWLLFAVGRLSDVPVLLGNLSWEWSPGAIVGVATICLFALPLMVGEWMAERSEQTLVAAKWRLRARVTCYAVAWFLVVVSAWVSVMSSSIFSSENLRAYRRLPLAERRRHLLLVVLLVVLLLAGHWLADAVGEALLPHSSLAPFVLARQALSESTEVIFAGSSHVLLGIRPDLFSVEAMNVAGPGWDYRALEAAVRGNLERMPNLRLAVVELDLFPMRIDTSTVQRGRCRSLRVWGITQEQVPCTDRPTGEGSLGAWSAALIPSPRLTPWATWETIKPRFTGPLENRGPIAGHRRVAAVGDPAAHGPRRVEWLESRFAGSYVERNREALERLTTLLRQRGVRVVLLRMPHQEAFTSSVPEDWARQVAATTNRLDGPAGEDTPVWDYDRASGFEAHDFMDSVHLNTSGVQKLRDELDPRLRAELGYQ